MPAVPPAQRLAIAQVTPFAWEATNEVNAYVARVSEELAGRGHQVLVIAPSHSARLVRDTRRALRSQPEQLLEDAGGGEVRVLGVGEVLPAGRLDTGRCRPHDRGGARRATARRGQRA